MAGNWKQPVGSRARLSRLVAGRTSPEARVKGEEAGKRRSGKRSELRRRLVAVV